MASEVKQLVNQTSRATDDIARQIGQLKQAVGGSVAAIQTVISVIEEIDEAAAAAAAAAVEEQSAANAEIGRSATNSAGGASHVSSSVLEIRDQTDGITGIATDVSRRMTDTQGAVADLKRRLVIALRQSAAGDRRGSDRIPCEETISLIANGKRVPGTLLDFSLGGVLVSTDPSLSVQEGQSLTVCLPGVGDLSAQTASISELGLHLTFRGLNEAQEAALAVRHHQLTTAEATFIQSAQSAATALSHVLEDSLARGEISEEELFLSALSPIPGTSPQQHLAPFTDLTDRLFPAVQEPVLNTDPRIQYCVAAALSGYVPTHNSRYSEPQRPNDTAWNALHARNRRVFSDRTGLAAARNTRPFLLQAYRRDLGDGRIVRLKEVNAPILVRDRHWGGVRLAYTV